jgi:tetratricopeptide (TPR) repeat protein
MNSLSEYAKDFARRDAWSEGRRFFEDVARRNPRNAEACAHLGFFSVKESRYDTRRGMAEYEAALRLDPACAAAYLYRAVTRAYLGQRQAAVADLRAAETNGADPDDLLWAKGCVELEAGSAEKAAALFNRLVERRADSSGYLMLAKAYAQAGKNMEALDSAAKAAEADPRDFRAWVYAGIYLAYLQRYEEARASLSRAETMEKRYALLHHAWAYVARAEGKTTETEERLRTALDVDPDYVTSRKMLADLCAETGRPEEARRHYKAALELFPDYAEAREGLACLGTGS